MPDPSTVDIPVDVWTPIATDILQGLIVRGNALPDAYYLTSRPAGSVPPPVTDPDDAAFLGIIILMDVGDFVMGFSEPTDVYMLSTGNAGSVIVAPYALSSLKGITGSSVVSNIPEDFFARGLSFTYADYLSYGTDETKEFIFDPTVYVPPPGAQQRIVGFVPAFSAEAGPITVDIYEDTTEPGDGASLVLFNRDRSSANVPQSTFKLNPSAITTPGTKLPGILVPATAGGPVNVGTAQADPLPFALDTTKKYRISVKNTNGADVLVGMSFTFFEI